MKDLLGEGRRNELLGEGGEDKMPAGQRAKENTVFDDRTQGELLMFDWN